jgi:hypothetical protein
VLAKCIDFAYKYNNRHKECIVITSGKNIMNYRKFLSSSHVDFKINDHLIQFGATTWQIRNIAATSISRKTVPFNEPEPKFETPEPKLSFSFSTTAMLAVAAWVIVRFIFSSPNIAVLLALGIFAGMIFLSVENLKKEKSVWLAEKTRVENNWKIWNEMRTNPPLLYSLMLETNAGSKPLFYSFDEAQIAKANDAIKQSMEKKETGDVTFAIETVNVGAEDSINNFGSSIYQQSIQQGV